MCHLCLDKDIEGWSFEDWKKYRITHNSRGTIPRNQCLDQDKKLPKPPSKGEAGKCIQWAVIIMREVYPFEDDSLQLGIGIPTKEGRADQNYDHIISDGFKTTYYQEHPHYAGVELHNKLKPCRTLHAGYWTSSCELTLTECFNHIIKFSGISKQLQPLASIRTDFGVLNLIPSQKIPSLLKLCAKTTAAHITCLKNIDKLIIPKICKEEIGKAWIRFHAIVVLSLELNIDSQ